MDNIGAFGEEILVARQQNERNFTVYFWYLLNLSIQ